MPEQYIKDAVEYFYMQNKLKMHSLSYVIFNISGLGRFIIRPFKFWNKKKMREVLLADFDSRRDNRGIMIRKSLEERYQQMLDIEPEVQKLFEYKQQQMYGHKKDLEKQI